MNDWPEKENLEPHIASIKTDEGLRFYCKACGRSVVAYYELGVRSAIELGAVFINRHKHCREVRDADR